MPQQTPEPDRLQLWPAHRADLRLVGRSPLTIRDRQNVLARLANGLVDLADMGPGNIRAFVGREHLSDASRATYLNHLRSFYQWAVVNDLLNQDPTAKVPRVRVAGGVPHPIDVTDLTAAWANATPRVRCWLMLGAYAGLRAAEAAGLTGEAVGTDTLRVTGKGGKTRIIPLHPALAAELAHWPTSGPLFPDTSPNVVSSAVSRHMKRHGIPASMHSTRHRFATDLHAVEHDILAVKDALGHSSIQTTQVYAQLDRPGLTRQVNAIHYPEQETA